MVFVEFFSKSREVDLMRNCLEVRVFNENLLRFSMSELLLSVNLDLQTLDEISSTPVVMPVIRCSKFCKDTLPSL